MYADPIKNGYVRHIDPMLTKSLRQMRGFPEELERKILEQNRRYIGDDVHWQKKRVCVGVEVLHWLYHRRLHKSVNDVYYTWKDFEKMICNLQEAVCYIYGRAVRGAAELL